MKPTDTFVRSAAVLILTLSFSLLGVTALAQSAQEIHQMDSLKALIQIQEGEELLDTYYELTLLFFYHERDPQRILDFYSNYEKEARKQNNINQLILLHRNRIIQLSENNQWKEVIKLSPEALQLLYANEKWEHYCMVYNRYAMSYLANNQPDKAIELATTFYEQSKEINHPDAILQALHLMGKIYAHQQKLQEAVNSLNHAVEEAEKQPKVTPVQLDIYFYLTQQLIILLRLEEAENTLTKWEVALDRLEKDMGEEAMPLRANLYRMYIALYNAFSNYDKVAYYCNKLEALNFNNFNVQAALNINRLAVALHRKEYEKAFEHAEKNMELARIANNPEAIRQARISRLRALIFLNRTQEADEELGKLALYSDSIKSMAAKEELDKLRVTYEVDKLETEKERQRLIAFWAITGCALLVVVVIIVVLYSRKLHRKNLSLYRQIQERSRSEQEIEKITEQIPEQELSRHQKLYRDLNRLMQNEKLFTNQNLDRNDFAERLGTNRQYLADAVKEETGLTLGTYITELRLKHALNLLSFNQELTLEAVAEESGFASYSPFFRAFTQKYGISPSEYRKLSKEKVLSLTPSREG